MIFNFNMPPIELADKTIVNFTENFSHSVQGFDCDCCGGSWDDYEVIYEFTFKDSSKAKLIFSSDGYFPADSGKLTLFLLINKEQLKSLTFSELADKLDGSLTEPSTEKELSNFLKPRY